MNHFIKLLGASVILITITYYSVSCQEGPSRGQQLAIIYCGACHQVPEPNLLDKVTWKENVLPQMGMLMGLTPIADLHKFNMEENYKISQLGVIPTKPMVNATEFQQIIEYYVKNAPEKLKNDTTIVYKPLENLFDIKEYPFIKNELTLIKFDTISKKLYLGSRFGQLFKLSPKDGKILNKININSPATDIHFKNSNSFYLTISGKLEPNFDYNGTAVLGKIQKDSLLIPQLKIQNLARPTSLATADFNQDGKEDLLITSFGYFTGKLAWYENNGSSTMIEHIIKPVAGATIAYVKDMNNDKLPDIVALFGQGNEGVFIFYNKGNGNFDEEQVLKFPPVYGSLNIELQDFNKDGFFDILYTNGDNGDFSPIMKPYHGIRIFMNDGKNKFTQKYFFPMNGAIKSMARDFDGDGDLDIISASFFPNYDTTPNKSVVFLQNNTQNPNAQFQFTPSVSAKTDVGRWMVMDAFDYDNDGDDDVLIGACYDAARVSRIKNAPPKTTILLLENKSKK